MKQTLRQEIEDIAETSWLPWENGRQTLNYENMLDRILQAISQRDAELVEKLEKIRRRFKCGKCEGAKNLYHTQCCTALSDVLTMIKGGKI